MSVRRILTIAWLDLRVIFRDPVPIVTLILMPLIVMAFIKPTYRVALIEEGYVDANGAEQAVPGFAIMFAFFLVGAVSFSFFREHGWNTWERLRASSTTSAEVMAGNRAHAGTSHSVPYLTESWYCCAEPTDEQFARLV